MKSVTAKVMLVLVICATPTRAQDDSLGTRQTLADAGYRYDDPASLMRALEDENGLVAVIATNYLAQQRATPDIIAALRAASGSPRESVAASAFGALQKLGATGWEGSAIGLLQGTRDHTIRLPLARVLAQAGRSEGWFIVRDALTPDDRSMGLALWSVGPFHGLKLADGTPIDALSELRRLQGELRQRAVRGSLSNRDPRHRGRSLESAPGALTACGFTWLCDTNLSHGGPADEGSVVANVRTAAPTAARITWRAHMASTGRFHGTRMVHTGIRDVDPMTGSPSIVVARIRRSSATA